MTRLNQLLQHKTDNSERWGRRDTWKG